MSRSGGKAGSSRDKPKPLPAAPPTVAVPDIVPGKFNENDWFAMLEKDNAEDFIIDLIDEILAQTMESIYRLYLQRQIVPFIVYQAANDMLHIVGWKFLGRDEGEESISESGWIQDEEPNTAVMDSWAQGAVPRTEVSTVYLIQEEEGEALAESEKRKIEELELLEPLGVKDKDMEAKTVKEQPVVIEAHYSDIQETAAKKMTKPKYSPQHKKLKPAAAPMVTDSAEPPLKKSVIMEMPVSVSMSSRVSGKVSCQSNGKARQFSHYSDVKLDEKGNTLSVRKLDPDNLPTHRVSLKYQIMEQSMKKERLEDTQRLLNMRMQLRKRSGPQKRTVSLTAGKSMAKTRKYVPVDCPPSLLENINIVPGVSVMESGHTKRLAKRTTEVSDTLDQHLKDAHPISVAFRDRSNTISVCDLLDRDTPIIRPLDDSKPLPPILPASSNTTNCSS